MVGQGLGSLLPVWEIWMEFSVSGFSLAQLWLLWPFGEWTNRREISLFLSVFQINK